MDFWRIILFICIIILFFYIFFRLFLQYNVLQKQQRIETFELNTKIKNLDIDGLIKNYTITDLSYALELKQFVIKSSYNTAFTGIDLSLGLVTEALHNGYRWLDFFTSDFKIIGYSKDETMTGVLNTATNPTFDDIFTIISTNAFTSPNSPNPNDPLFIQIRTVYDGQTVSDLTIKDLKDLVSDKNPLFKKIYNKKITDLTTIKEIQGSVIFVVDNKIFEKLPNKAGFLSNNDMTVMATIAPDFKNVIDPPQIKGDNFMTSPPIMLYQLLPKGYIKNLDMYSAIKNKGFQITPAILWSFDTYLQNYESIFEDAASAFVPLSVVLKYIENI